MLTSIGLAVASGRTGQAGSGSVLDELEEPAAATVPAEVEEGLPAEDDPSALPASTDDPASEGTTDVPAETDSTTPAEDPAEDEER